MSHSITKTAVCTGASSSGLLALPLWVRFIGSHTATLHGIGPRAGLPFPLSGIPGAAAVLLIMASLFVSPAGAQDGLLGPGSLPQIDSETQAAVLESVMVVLDSLYVMEAEGKQMSAHLRKGWSEGKWRDLKDPAEFVSRIDQEIHEVYNDGHLGLALAPLPDPNAQEAVDPRDSDRAREQRRLRNFGFREVKILPGNVGYLRLDEFADTDLGGNTAVAAMNFLANADALIIDLRRNGGGSASMIQLLAGYLLEDQEHLINWYQRARNRTVQSYSAAYVPGKKMPEIPLYILTSQGTFSAAEEFTFDMKNLERGTVVGETTGGGGNTVAGYSCDFDNFRLLMRASFGAATDPRTGEGWEGKGVTPHIEVPADQALDTAHREALSTLLAAAESDTDPDRKAQLEWVRLEIHSRLHPVVLTAGEMKQYAGDYGPRKILLQDGGLLYQRENRPPYRMHAMGEDLFRLEDLDYFRIRFQRGDDGKIAGLHGMYDSGRTDYNGREK